MVNTISYDQFDATKNDGFWSVSAGTLTTHQSNGTLGVNDFIFVASSLVEGNVQATQFANKQVSYTWGFAICSHPADGSGTLVITQVSAGVDSRGNQDTTQNCPTMTNVQHSGTPTLGSDGVLALKFSSQQNFGNLVARAYVGNFALQITSDAVALSTSSGVPVSSASGSTSGSNSLTSTTIASESGTVTGTNLSNLPSINVSWAPGQTTSTINSSQGPNGGGGASTPPGNQGAMIGGASAGAIVAITALVGFCIWNRRRRKRAADEEHKIVLLVAPLPHEENGFLRGEMGTHKRTKANPSRHSILRAGEKNAIAASDQSLQVTSPDTPQPTITPARFSRHPPSIFSATGPPAYDSHRNINQDPLFLSNTADQHGPYTLDDTFRVHDLLGEWAEENRDAVPYHLERRLRSGGYVPGTHPNSISPEIWMSRFVVTRFELVGLVELFERTNGMPSHRPRSTAGSDSVY